MLLTYEVGVKVPASSVSIEKCSVQSATVSKVSSI